MAAEFKTKRTPADTKNDFLAPTVDHAPYKFHGIDFRDALVKESPRNWSLSKKRLLFAALISSSLLADGGMTWGATLIVAQAEAWNVTIDYSSTSMNYGILLQGFGGIIAVPFIEAYGRLPVWFSTQLVTMLMVLGATLSTSWSMFTTFRSLQGLFGTVPQVVGLSIIHDMYDPQEWPRMINIWATTFLVGPFLGPALAGYILEGSRNQWKIPFAVLTGLYALSTLMIILFGHETHYSSGAHHRHDNQNHGDQQHTAPLLTRICHSITIRAKSLFGISGNQLSQIGGADRGVGDLVVSKREIVLSQSTVLLRLIFKIPLLLPGIGVMINFCWPIGITTTVDTFLHAPPYLFNNIQASSMRFAGVIGATSGYIVGHFFNHWIYNHYKNSHPQDSAKTHNKDNKYANDNGNNNKLERATSANSSLHTEAHIISTHSESASDSAICSSTSSSSSPASPSSWRPEYRLHGVWLPIASLASGLVAYGLTLNYEKSWVGLALGWAMVNLGMVGSTVAITAYALEKFPSYSTPVSAIINMWRTCGGFSVAYFQASWIARNGVGVVFGLQAAIVVVGVVLTIVPVFVLGKRESSRA